MQKETKETHKIIAEFATRTHQTEQGLKKLHQIADRPLLTNADDVIWSVELILLDWEDKLQADWCYLYLNNPQMYAHYKRHADRLWREFTEVRSRIWAMETV